MSVLALTIIWPTRRSLQRILAHITCHNNSLKRIINTVEPADPLQLYATSRFPKLDHHENYISRSRFTVETIPDRHIIRSSLIFTSKICITDLLLLCVKKS
jgi:hypothetical protein